MAQVNLVPTPKKPIDLYEQSVQGFEKLGQSDPWSSVGSHGAASSDSDCHVARDYMIPYFNNILLIRFGLCHISHMIGPYHMKPMIFQIIESIILR